MVPAKTVPTVPVSGSGSVREPPCRCDRSSYALQCDRGGRNVGPLSSRGLLRQRLPTTEKGLLPWQPQESPEKMTSKRDLLAWRKSHIARGRRLGLTS